MTRDLSIAGFIEHLARVSVEMHVHTHHALERAAQVVEAEAKREIGHYQDQAGKFVAWAELADSTKQDRVHQGYPENEPLLRTGDMRDSIHHQVELHGTGGEAVVGSDSAIAEYQELGTSRIPPRSFLAGALVRKTGQVTELLGESVVKALVGEEVVGGSLPID